MPKTPPALLWFRRDLRLADNPALIAALGAGGPVIPIFIRDDSGHQRLLGGAARWWLGRSLGALAGSLEKLGAPLILRRGASLPILRQLLRETGARNLHFNRRFDPPGQTIDRAVTEALQKDGITVDDHAANYLHEPWQLQTGQGQFFKVFTPFWRRLADQYSPAALSAAPRQWPAFDAYPNSDPLKSLQFEHPWAAGFTDHWQPGEEGAHEKLTTFLDETVEDYAGTRDRPDISGTSRLSPHLAWGEISVHRAWRQADPARWEGAAAFRRELAWRDFNMHVYANFPELPHQPWQQNFHHFPFERDPEGLHAWERGQTGYPLVDAGMRELWHTGWMHNRVRMVVASFLIKHQLIDWRLGEGWFWDTLVDADPAQNAGNWQWVAGCGFDAAPFFRIFNPTLQAEKFDPKGAYIRQWVPELSALTAKEINQPWKIAASRSREADVVIGKTYPEPIVEHDLARKRALTAYRQISGRADDADQPELFS